jgi:hypothetical protein
MPTEVVNPVWGVGATPEEGARLEMELDIMRLYTKLISDWTRGSRRKTLQEKSLHQRIRG